MITILETLAMIATWVFIASLKTAPLIVFILIIRNFSKKSMWWSLVAVVLMISIAAVAATGAVTLKSEPITIKLGEYGQVEINGDSVDPQKVASILKKEYDLEKAHVSVETSVETNAAAIVEVSRQLVFAGISSVSFLNRTSGKSLSAQLTIDDRPMPSSSINIKYFQQDGKWGFIDKDNNIVIEPQFSSADFFYDSRAVVQVGDKYGVIDQSGAMIIEPEYDMIANYHMGVCFAVIFENRELGIAAQQAYFDLAGNRIKH
ncbi:WG repeat-containing protein [candidate division KSB1 bacterium]|nr:WG repeat-containing protein [candidate division KSB1 bacterium]